MKAILEFELPEDETYHKRAIEGGALHTVLWDFDQYLRTHERYHDCTVSQTHREYLRELLSSAGVSIYD